MSKVNIVLDASMYDMFLLCARRYHYRYNRNLTLPVKAKALDRGTLVHLACETYYTALQQKAPYDYAANSALMKVKAAGAVESDLDPKDVERVVEVMEEYFDYWRVEDQNLEIVGVEQPFLYRLFEDEDISINMAGKIDLLVSNDRYTNLPYDHKSYDRASELGRLSNQFINYCNAIGSQLLVVDRIGFQKTLPAHEKFRRIPLSYDPFIFMQWKNNVIRNLNWYLECVATGYWPMNETSCDKFNRRCEYYEVCDSSGEDAKEFKLLNNYIQIDPWDVSKALAKTSELVKDKSND